MARTRIEERHRDRFEKALGRDGFAALVSQCSQSGLDFRRWPDVAALRDFVIFTTCSAMVRRLQRSKNISQRRAIDQTAAYFGLQPAAVASLIRRAQRQLTLGKAA